MTLLSTLSLNRWSNLLYISSLSVLLPQSALFNFQSLLTVILLLICTCAYVRSLFPSLLDRHKTG